MKLEEMDFDHLLRLRLVVARFGEMDMARWWNTKGLLGHLGSLALKRGFFKSHCFAQARAVFSAAEARCRQIFNPPGCMTLWHLPAAIEDQFETQWATRTEQHEQWDGFFEKLQDIQRVDLLATMLERETSWLTSPASTRYHLNEEKGLLKHSVAVAETLLKFRDCLAPNIPDESCVIVGLFHDVIAIKMKGE